MSAFRWGVVRWMLIATCVELLFLALGYIQAKTAGPYLAGVLVSAGYLGWIYDR